MDDEKEIMTLRMLIDKHIAAEEYGIAIRYVSMLDDLQNNEDGPSFQ